MGAPSPLFATKAEASHSAQATLAFRSAAALQLSRALLYRLLPLVLLLRTWGAAALKDDDRSASAPAFDDDHGPALERLRERLASSDMNATYGVVLASGPAELQWSQLTIPVWEQYCARHGYDLVVQQEPLATDHRFDWTRVRTVIESLHWSKWNYLWLVAANTLPANMSQPWQHIIKQEMRHKRYKNDETKDRYMYCPWDCERGHKNYMEEGACYGPHLTGCVLWAARKQTLGLVSTWYEYRNDPDMQHDLALRKSLQLTKEVRGNWNKVFYKYTEDIGFPDSSLLATFGYDEKHGWDYRGQIYEYISNNKALGAAANLAQKLSEGSGEL